MPVIRVGKVGIYVQEWGAGEPLMMVHGLGMSSDLWVHQVPAFSERYHIIAVDLRGFGRSDRPTDPGAYAVEVLAGDIASVAHELGITNMHYLGTSMGGFIGQALALAEPRLCRSLVLCHTGCRMSIPQDILETRIKALREMSMGEYGRIVATQALAPEPDPALFEWVVQKVARNDKRTYTQVLTEGLANFDVTDRIGTIQAPTLVIVGDCDRVIPPDEGREVARRIPGAQLITLSGAGHLSYAERPDAFNEVVLRFLNSVDQGRRTLGGCSSFETR